MLGYDVGWKETGCIRGIKAYYTRNIDRLWETSLPTFSLYQQLKDICNTDKFELFYESFPNKTYYLKSDKCSVGKLSKIAITGLVVANVKTWNEK